jgi:hypothetical protein
MTEALSLVAVLVGYWVAGWAYSWVLRARAHGAWQ